MFFLRWFNPIGFPKTRRVFPQSLPDLQHPTPMMGSMGPEYVLGCPRKVGSMVSKWVITYL